MVMSNTTHQEQTSRQRPGPGRAATPSSSSSRTSRSRRCANATGYPLAFPRPNVKKVIDNDRVVIWDYTWTPGVPTPTHFHDKDVVVTYLEDGALRSTDPAGASVINEHYFGFTKLNSRDRVHTEELVKGKARAIIVELK